MTNSNSKKLIYEALRKLAMMKGEEISQERHTAYCEYLEKYDTQKVLLALKELLETLPKFPDIAHIIKIIDPPMSENDKANVMVNAIMDALTKFGTYQPKEAREELGEIAWHVVEGMGGWKTLCMATYDELGTMRAQMREMAKSTDKLAKKVETKNLLKHEKTALKRLDFSQVSHINGAGNKQLT